MALFFVLALLGTMFTGPGYFAYGLYVIDQQHESCWVLEALDRPKYLHHCAETGLTWAEGDVIRVLSINGRIVWAVTAHKKTARRRSDMAELLFTVRTCPTEDSDP